MKLVLCAPLEKPPLMSGLSDPAPRMTRNPLKDLPCRASVILPSYLAGLFWLRFDADEDIQLLHERRDTLGLHLNVLFNVKH